MRFLNKVAVVTGAGQGIGETYAKRLAAEGADATYSDPVDHLVEESRLDEGDAWGEALPPGLTLGRPA